MAIALLASVGLFASLQAWFAPRQPASRTTSLRGTSHAPTPVGATRVSHRLPAASPARQRAAQRPPLRVRRVVEPHTPGAGRMVISGSMDDVCAELDRLAALEARRH